MKFVSLGEFQFLSVANIATYISIVFCSIYFSSIVCKQMLLLLGFGRQPNPGAGSLNIQQILQSLKCASSKDLFLHPPAFRSEFIRYFYVIPCKEMCLVVENILLTSIAGEACLKFLFHLIVLNVS